MKGVVVMKLMKRIDCLLRAVEAAITTVKVTVVLLGALAGFVVVAAGLLAYLKREQWTKPAYRWARDQSGRWSATPWAPTDKTAN